MRAQFDLIEVDGEGILLNRESGNFYRLNRSACLIWTCLIAGETTSLIVDRLVRDFGITADQAQRDVRAALAEPPSSGSPRASEEHHWSPTADGYGFFAASTMLCQVDGRGDFLRVCLDERTQSTAEQVALRLRSVVPKILALRQIRALHASAVEVDGSLLVFSGRSGAGKTTTARLLAEWGARLVSEDLLVLAENSAAVLEAERVIRSWVMDQGAKWAADPNPDRPIDCRELDRCLDGGQRPLRRIMLIDAQRRAGDRVVLEDMPRPEAFLALIESVYFASRDSRTWHTNFEWLRRLVTAIPTARAVMPMGLLALRTALEALATAK